MVVGVVMTIITVYIMFAADIRVLTTSKQGDLGFYGVNCVVIAFFGIEIILNVVSLDSYLLSFNFFLDLVSTVSIILDIGWITDSFNPEITSGASPSDI